MAFVATAQAGVDIGLRVAGALHSGTFGASSCDARLLGDESDEDAGWSGPGELAWHGHLGSGYLLASRLGNTVDGHIDGDHDPDIEA